MGAPTSRSSWTDIDLTNAVSQATSIYGVFRILNLRPGGGQHLRIKTRIKELALDIKHFTGKLWSKGIKTGKQPPHTIPLDKILVENSTYQSTAALKKRLIKAGLLTNQCAICALLPEWQGKPLTLRLDHINGIRADNKIQNLRIICPNCDAQTPTFAGRNKKKKA